ncbi:MAG: hypothetical protein ACRDFQ_03395 [Anaerolineales bacterium]
MSLHQYIKTLVAFALLLASPACFVRIEAPPELASPTPTETPTVTPTIVWFPPAATFTPFPAPNVSPTVDLRSGIGELLLEDDFSDEAMWSTIRSDSASAVVSDNQIALTLKKNNNYLITTRSAPIFSNFYAEITARPSLCRGSDEFGLIVRAGESTHFRLALTCDGRARVYRYGGSLTAQTSWSQDPAIPTVVPSTSRLGVWARNDRIHFFVNDIYLFTVTDSQFFTGTIGVFVHTAGEDDVSASFSNLQVWQVD